MQDQSLDFKKIQNHASQIQLLNNQEANSVTQNFTSSNQSPYYNDYKTYFADVQVQPQSLYYKLLQENGVEIQLQDKEDQNIFQIIEMTPYLSENIFKIKVRLGQFNFEFMGLYQTESSSCHQFQLFAFGSYGKIYKFKTKEKQQKKQGNHQPLSYIVKCLFLNNQDFSQFFIESIKQYSFYYLMSTLQIGPHLKKYFGFDFIIHKDCIQFTMQACSITQYKPDLQFQLKHLLKKIHSLSIVHMDIKPTNIMHSQYFKKPVFIDFGLSKKLKQKIGKETLTIFSGTFRYCSKQMKKALGKKIKVDLYYNDIQCLKQSILEINNKNGTRQMQNQKQAIRQKNYKQVILKKKEFYHFQFSFVNKNYQRQFILKESLQQIQNIFQNFNFLEEFTRQVIIFLTKIQFSSFFKTYLFKIAQKYFNNKFQLLRSQITQQEWNIYAENVKNCPLSKNSTLIQRKINNCQISRDCQNIKKYLSDKNFNKLISKEKYYQTFLQYISFIKPYIKSSLQDKVKVAKKFIQFNNVKDIKEEYMIKCSKKQSKFDDILTCLRFLLRQCLNQNANRNFLKQNFKSVILQLIFLERVTEQIELNHYEFVANIIFLAFKIYDSFYDVMLFALQIYQVQNLFSFTIRQEECLALMSAKNLLFQVRYYESRHHFFRQKKKQYGQELSPIELNLDLIIKAIEYSQTCPKYGLTYEQSKKLKDQIIQQIKCQKNIPKLLKQFTINHIKTNFLIYLKDLYKNYVYEVLDQAQFKFLQDIKTISIDVFKAIPLMNALKFKLGFKFIGKVDEIFNCRDISSLFFQKERVIILIDHQSHIIEGIKHSIKILQKTKSYEDLFFLLSIQKRLNFNALSYSPSFLILQNQDFQNNFAYLLKQLNEKIVVKVKSVLQSQRKTIQFREKEDIQKKNQLPNKKMKNKEICSQKLNEISIQQILQKKYIEDQPNEIYNQAYNNKLLMIMENSYLQLLINVNKFLVASIQDKTFFYQLFQKQYPVVLAYLKNRYFFSDKQEASRKAMEVFLRCEIYLKLMKYSQIFKYVFEGNISVEQKNYQILLFFIEAYRQTYLLPQCNNMNSKIQNSSLKYSCEEFYKKILKKIWTKLKKQKIFDVLLVFNNFLFYIWEYLFKFQGLKQVFQFMQDYCLWINLSPSQMSVRYLLVSILNFFQSIHFLNLNFYLQNNLAQYNRLKCIKNWKNPYWYMACCLIFNLDQQFHPQYYIEIRQILKNTALSINLMNKFGKKIVLTCIYNNLLLLNNISQYGVQMNSKTQTQIQKNEKKQQKLLKRKERKLKYLSKIHFNLQQCKLQLQDIVKVKLNLAKKEKHQIFYNVIDQKLTENSFFLYYLVKNVVKYHKCQDNIDLMSIKRTKIFQNY